MRGIRGFFAVFAAVCAASAFAGCGDFYYGLSSYGDVPAADRPVAPDRPPADTGPDAPLDDRAIPPDQAEEAAVPDVPADAEDGGDAAPSDRPDGEPVDADDAMSPDRPDVETDVPADLADAADDRPDASDGADVPPPTDVPADVPPADAADAMDVANDEPAPVDVPADMASDAAADMVADGPADLGSDVLPDTPPADAGTDASDPPDAATDAADGSVDAADVPDAAPPELVIDYVSDSGPYVIPPGRVTSIIVSFDNSGNWSEATCVVETLPCPSCWRCTIPRIPEARRSAQTVLFTVPNACGIDTGRTCPPDWPTMWTVTWFGRRYDASSTVAREGGDIPALERVGSPAGSRTPAVRFNVP